MIESGVAMQTIKIEGDRITIDLNPEFVLDRKEIHNYSLGVTGEKWMLDAAFIFYLFMKEKGKL